MKLVTTIITLVVIAGVIVITDHLKPRSTSTASNQTQTTASTQTTPTNTASNTSSNTASSNASSTTSATTQTTTSSYKDGTYTATSEYYVPHGDESIEVSLTLSNGVITAASIQNSEDDPTSASYQEAFAASYKSYVVGQKISGLQLNRVSGASDTSQGFNDALSQIASKAQA